MKYSSDLNLGEGFCICTSFHFPDSGLYLLNGFEFYFELFWRAWHWKPAIDHENDLIQEPCLICFLFIMDTIFWETSMEMDVITLNVIVIVKNKSTTIFHGWTLIDHRHDIKMFKTLQWNHSPVVLGSTWVLNMLTSLLWSIRVKTIERP